MTQHQERRLIDDLWVELNKYVTTANLVSRFVNDNLFIGEQRHAKMEQLKIR